MSLVIRKAERQKAKLRLGISAPTGAGKTYSSLLIASGIGAKIGMVDTENGSGDLYAEDAKIKAALPNGYDIINIDAPYDPQKYIEAITAFENANYDVIIIDSLSHAWAGSGGLLDKHGKESDRGGNSYTAWRKITPQHNALVDKILQSPSHVIATLRAKTEYVQEKNDQGKTIVRKVGLAPVMRDGIEYEFTIFGEIDQSNNFRATKDRTNTLRDVFIVPTKKFGEQIKEWLESGVEPESPLMKAASELEARLNNCTKQMMVEVVVSANGRLLETLKTERPERYEEIMAEIKKIEEAFRFQDAAE